VRLSENFHSRTDLAHQLGIVSYIKKAKSNGESITTFLELIIKNLIQSSSSSQFSPQTISNESISKPKETTSKQKQIESTSSSLPSASIKNGKVKKDGNEKKNGHGNVNNENSKSLKTIKIEKKDSLSLQKQKEDTETDTSLESSRNTSSSLGTLIGSVKVDWDSSKESEEAVLSRPASAAKGHIKHDENKSKKSSKDRKKTDDGNGERNNKATRSEKIKRNVDSTTQTGKDQPSISSHMNITETKPVEKNLIPISIEISKEEKSESVNTSITPSISNPPTKSINSTPLTTNNPSNNKIPSETNASSNGSFSDVSEDDAPLTIITPSSSYLHPSPTSSNFNNIIPTSLAQSLRQIVFGNSKLTFGEEWIGKGFRFRMEGHLLYKLIQLQQGPCGLLAVLQGFIIKWLAFAGNDRSAIQ